MFRRAVGSLLARRFSPRATPRTAPARSLHSLRDLPIGDGLVNASIFAGGVLAGCGSGWFAVQHFEKGNVHESAPGKVTGARNRKKLDMKERFELWIVENDKTYRDEEEKAMRFELFKDAVEMMESHRPLVQQSMLPEISYFADFTKEERQKMLAFPDRTFKKEYNEMVKAMQEKGESLTKRPDVKKGHMPATKVPA